MIKLLELHERRLNTNDYFQQSPPCPDVHYGSHHALPALHTSSATTIHPPYPVSENFVSRDLDSLEFMNAHRESHAAEMGQFIPRDRRNSISGDFASGITPSRSNTINNSSAVRSSSWPPSSSESLKSISPTFTFCPVPSQTFPLDESTESITSPLMTHSRECIVQNTRQRKETIPKGVEISFGSRTTPQLRRKENLVRRVEDQPLPIKACPSSWTERIQEQMQDKTSNEWPASLLDPQDADRLSRRNTRTRKLNSGFEVLPAGTLEQPTPTKNWGVANEALGVKVNARRGSKKLQKRNRSGSRSSCSSLEQDRSGKANEH